MEGYSGKRVDSAAFKHLQNPSMDVSRGKSTPFSSKGKYASIDVFELKLSF
jgi:hypothetical protein